MSLDHILIGFLRQPATGYELKRRFDESASHFWNATQSQIYRTLYRLEADGLLRSDTEESEIGPERRVYHATRKGAAALRRWLEDGPEIDRDRIGYLSQVFFLDRVDDETGREFFVQLRQRFRRKLAVLRAMEGEMSVRLPGYPDRLDDEDRCHLMALRLGILRHRSTLVWAEECLQGLR